MNRPQNLGLALVTLLLAALPHSAPATVLTFDIRYVGNSTYWGSGESMETYFYDYGDFAATTPTGPILMGYPDRVTGPNGPYDVWYNYGNPNTPNVAVSYNTPGGDLKTYGVAPWDNLVVTGYDDGDMVLAFTPDAGYAVAVTSFVLESWNSQANQVEWTLRQNSDAGPILASSDANGNGQPGGPALTFTADDTNPGQTMATDVGYFAGTLVLTIDLVSGPVGYLALDDVVFEQQLVPEPASMALMGLAGVAAVLRRRSR
jgi:hypothetical protein